LDLSVHVIGFLALVGLCAGFVDSIAGGGGLLTVPALLSVGLPPQIALGSNKLQGSFGTFSASLNFIRRGEVGMREMAWPFATTFAGAALGTIAVQALDPRFLADLIPFLLVGIAIYFVLAPKAGEIDTHARISPCAFVLGVAPVIGFYDGFFGPGTGSFFAIAFVALLGHNLRRATAETKVLNFASNLASLAFFVIGGNVAWVPGLAMGAGQLVGARLGSGLVIRRGAGLVRPVLVIVSLALTARLLFVGEASALARMLGWM
jgi:uncharacterized membrane protein YfcA